MNTTGRKIDSLQALRAFAAISVMLFHGTEVLYDEVGYVFLKDFFRAGFSGVQLFFVLSGFIIFYTSYSKNLTIKDFLLKRFIRIYPVHTLVIISFVLLYFISPTPDTAYRGTPSAIISSLTLLPFGEMVLGPSWTLCYEVRFYLLFALTFLISVRLFFNVVACWVALIVLSYLFHFNTGVNAIDNLYDTRNFNFIFGCLVAWLYISYPNIKYSDLILFPAALLFITCWILNIRGILRNEDLMFLYFGVPSALLIIGVLYSKIKVPKLLIHLGDASFSIYLLHFPLARFLLKASLKLGINRHTNYFIIALGIFILTIIISSLFYRYVEKTLLILSNKLFKREKKLTENTVQAA